MAEIFWNVIVFQGKSQSDMRNYKLHAATVIIVSGFVVCLSVMVFPVNDYTFLREAKKFISRSIDIIMRRNYRLQHLKIFYDNFSLITYW